MRASGILMPVSALSSPYGIGNFGKEAYKFVDFLSKANQKYWQILPMGPTGYADSPYQSFSAFALSYYYIDLDQLVAEKLLKKKEILAYDFGASDKVDYNKLYLHRKPLLEKAVQRFDTLNKNFVKYKKQNAFWLKDYALFMAIKADQDMIAYSKWSSLAKSRKSKDLKVAEKKYAQEISFWEVVQYLAYTQWLKLKKYANQNAVSIVGDVPIYVSPDSSDLWANPELFQVDKDLNLTEVAGCPPDAFSADGQLWGNPLYDWDYHYAQGFSWWIKRVEQAMTLYDMVRIDHFRGFAGYYAIPNRDKTAVNGRWRVGPGLSIISAIKTALPNVNIIAEDLGFLTDDVRELLKQSGFPGMKILQFAFDSSENSDYLPHKYDKNCVVYTGTHDNTTTLNWKDISDKKDIDFCKEYMGINKDEEFTLSLIRCGLASTADTCIIPMADWLNLDEDARINTPSTVVNNWVWRLDNKLMTKQLVAKIARMTKIYGRSNR